MDRIAGEAWLPVDLGRVNITPFANEVGFGFVGRAPDEAYALGARPLVGTDGSDHSFCRLHRDTVGRKGSARRAFLNECFPRLCGPEIELENMRERRRIRPVTIDPVEGGGCQSSGGCFCMVHPGGQKPRTTHRILIEQDRQPRHGSRW